MFLKSILFCFKKKTQKADEMSEMKKELEEMRRIDMKNKNEIQELKNQLEQMRSKVSI